jgi:hypothetical protein
MHFCVSLKCTLTTGNSAASPFPGILLLEPQHERLSWYNIHSFPRTSLVIRRFGAVRKGTPRVTSVTMICHTVGFAGWCLPQKATRTRQASTCTSSNSAPVKPLRPVDHGLIGLQVIRPNRVGLTSRVANANTVESR